MGVPTIPAVFLDRARVAPDRVSAYHKEGGRWVGRTWGEAETAVRHLAAGLAGLGVRHGDRVAIVGETHHLWSEADMAVLCLGGVTVGVYPTCTTEQIRYHLEHSGARAAIVRGRELLGRVRQAAAGLDPPVALVLFEADGGPEGGGGPGVEPDVPTIAALEAAGAGAPEGTPDAFAGRIRELSPDDLTTIVYTSGTTGPPKGAMLTHRNWYAAMSASVQVLPVDSRDRALIFLPLAHSLQRQAGYAGLLTNATGAYATSIDRLMEEFVEVRPTVQASVPRIWEKFHAGLHARIAEASPGRRRIAAMAFDVARRRGRSLRDGRAVPWWLDRLYRLADRVVFRRLRAIFGGEVRFMVSGGAPIGVDLLEFFDDIGLRIYEGWGLTETAAPHTLNHPGAWRFGTVGRPLPGARVRIAPDGEIEVAGDNVFQGYWRDPAATAAAFTDDGWFRTGDVGRLDDDGFLRITDRKKDLIITSGGKNIAPQNIEGLLKRDPLISQAVVMGDRRKYLSALLTLDVQSAPADLAADPTGPAARARVAAVVDRVNADLARHEQIKRFAVLPRDLSLEQGELTPTLKVRRRVVAEHFAREIDGLYAD